MKKKLAILLAFVMLALLCACSKQTAEPVAEETVAEEVTTEEALAEEVVIEEAVAEEAEIEEVDVEESNLPEAPDYTQADSWVLLPENPDKEVDTFFIYPTVVMQSEYGDFASTDEALKNVPFVLEQMSSAYTDATNVYMPLYRQIALSYAATMNKDPYTYKECIHNNVPYEDLKAALDYYFENCNNGRPFILAGHSQGSCSCYVVLENYMKEHPEYLERMVATYAIGFGMDEAYYEKNTHLKFAEGETDTGVVVSWNTMGPGATEPTMIMAEPCLAINPINWKRDDTYASAEENLGSLVDGEIVMNYADAKVNQERGYVECNTEMEYMVMDTVFGDKCLHGGDYSLYYNNIKDNIAKRIAAYLNK